MRRPTSDRPNPTLEPPESPADPAASSDSPPPARVKAVACLGGISLERGVPPDQFHEYIRDASNLVWLDVQDPGPAELSMLLEGFGFHPLALEDVSKGQQRAKVDEYKGYLFVVTYAVLPAKDLASLELVEVDLFIGRNYVVTVHRGAVPAMEEAYLRWTRGGEMLREGVGFLVYTILDAVIDAYFPIIDHIEDEVDEIEISMFTQSRPEGVQNLLRVKRTLVTLRRVLYPLREIFNVFLRRDRPLFSSNTLIYIQDVHDHVLRLLDVLDIERDMVTGALEAYLTVISNRLNKTMKMLAVITVVVAVAGLTFGAWGMNFHHMPLSESPWGFALVTAGTCGLIGLVLVWGWCRGWFR